MGGIWLALRAVIWGKGLSLALLVVAVGGVAATVGASVYAASVQEAMLSERLDQTSEAAARLSITEIDFSEAVAKAAPELTRHYTAPQQGIESKLARFPITSSLTVRSVAVWRDNQCDHVVMVRGTCPTDGDGIAVLEQDGEEYGLKLGLALQPTGAVEPMGRIVGWYRPKNPADPYWGDRNYFERRRPTEADPAPKIASPLVSESRATQIVPNVLVADWMLRRDTVHVSDLSGILSRLQAIIDSPRTDSARYQARLLNVLTAFEKERLLVERAGLLVILQILLLAWYLLYLLVAASSEAREAEFALAKLRGHRLRNTLVFGATQPVLVLAAAIPLGALVGWGWVVALRGLLLPPGTQVVLSWASLAALAVTAAGGLVAILLANWRLVGDPVAEQLRGGTRARRRMGAYLVGAVLVTLAVAGTYQLQALGRTTTASGLGLLTPALVALAAGILGTQVVMLLARGWLLTSRKGRGIAGWLAARQLARRRGNGRVVILLVTSSAVVLFGANAWSTGAETRQSRASFELSAPAVHDVQLRLRSPAELLAAVRAADPEGRYAMAVLEDARSEGRGADRRLAVDSTRLAKVAAWPEIWGPNPLPAMAKQLREPTGPSVLLRGNLLELTVDVQRLQTAEPLTLQFEAETTGGPRPGSKLLGAMGTLRAGVHTYRVQLPSCQAGCRLRQLSLDRLSPVAVRGRLVLRELRVDGKPVDAAFDAGAAGWRPALALAGTAALAPGVRVDASSDAGGLVVDLRTGPIAQPLSVTPRDVPAVLPVVRASSTRLEQFYGSDKSSLERYDGIKRKAGVLLDGKGPDGTGRPVRSAGQAELLPRLGREGVVMDLEYAERELQPLPFSVRAEVWLTSDAPASIVAKLRAQDFQVGPKRSIAARQAALNTSGTAVAQSLYLVSSVAGFGLALGGTLLLLVVSARRRRYEVAALATVGVARKSIRRAEAAEAIALFGAAGLLTFGCVYLSTPLISVAAPSTVSALFGPRAPDQPWLELGGLTAAMTLVLFVIGWLVAAWLIRTSRPEVLREARP